MIQLKYTDMTVWDTRVKSFEFRNDVKKTFELLKSFIDKTYKLENKPFVIADFIDNDTVERLVVIPKNDIVREEFELFFVNNIFSTFTYLKNDEPVEYLFEIEEAIEYIKNRLAKE